MDLYARVINGEIVEYPIYLEHIKARGLPEFWFTKCETEEKPSVDEFSYAIQVPRVVDETRVVLGWTIQPMSLEQLLRKLPTNVEAQQQARRPIRPIVTDLPSEALIAKIRTLTEDHVEALLNTFAQTRGYKDLERAITYIGDKNPVWDAEGKFCRDLRSDTWVQLQTYFGEVIATPQVKPWPNSWRDIASNLPPLVWPVEVTA
jgi:hypothetical protein